MTMRWPIVLVLLLAIVPASADRIVHSDRYQESGRLLVELRPIFEALGAEVVWNGALRQITSTRGPLRVDMRIDEHRAYVNHTAVYLDVPPRLVASTTRVPLRFACEAFGGTVTYLGDRVRIVGGGPETVIVYLDGGGGGGVAPVPPHEPAGRWPFTATRLVTEDDLRGHSDWELTLMRYEIGARHGSRLEGCSPAVQAYFRAQPWYDPAPPGRIIALMGLEARNFDFIFNYQARPPVDE